jgi:hypothetical protein
MKIAACDARRGHRRGSQLGSVDSKGLPAAALVVAASALKPGSASECLGIQAAVGAPTGQAGALLGASPPVKVLLLQPAPPAGPPAVTAPFPI